MTNFKWFAPLAVLATAVVTNLGAETHCPGNVASLPFKIVNSHQIILPVSINQSGPYEFLVDTGSQLTLIDPSIASELHLQPEASIGILAVASYSQAQVVLPDSVEAGGHSVSKLLVAVRDLADARRVYPRIRGILGENFLARFDILIDYSHRMLCFDEGTRMRQGLRGERIPLEAQIDRQTDLPFTQPFLISVHLDGSGTRPTILRLDSGANAPVLYDDVIGTPSWIRRTYNREGRQVDGTIQPFRALAPDDVKVGTRWLRHVVFMTPGKFGAATPKPGQDGLLPTALFQRVFLSYADHFAIFDPK